MNIEIIFFKNVYRPEYQNDITIRLSIIKKTFMVATSYNTLLYYKVVNEKTIVRIAWE